jgi:hypothetical protein
VRVSIPLIITIHIPSWVLPNTASLTEVTDGNAELHVAGPQVIHSQLSALLPSMRGIWALPAVLRIALASQHAFSVFEDLLAFPQV